VTNAPLTINELLRQATGSLAHLPTPRLDAEVLLGHILGCSRTTLICERDTALEETQCASFAKLIAARASGTPIAHLRGAQEFWSLDLKISEAVLVPRADTELLVTLALERCAPADALCIADLGTGSGAIALALAHERPRSLVLAVERSAAALAVAEINRCRCAVPNMLCIRGSWLAALAPECLDIIVANPPYVADTDPVLSGPGLRCEPRSALAAGPEGLNDLRAIAGTALSALRAGGWLLLEHGADQGPAVRQMLQKAGFFGVTTACDLAGLERVTCGHRKAPDDG
jgi:release factor glutamine methyltransferase